MRKATWAGVAAACCLLVASGGAATGGAARAALDPGGHFGIVGPILRANCESRKGWACQRIPLDDQPVNEEATAFGWVDQLHFVLGAELADAPDGEADTQETVRFTLPPGLSWAGPGRAVPPTGWSFTPVFERCSEDGQVATCEVGVPAGTNADLAWLFDVTAKKSGYYDVKLEIGNRSTNTAPGLAELVRLKALVRDGGDALPGPVTASKPYLLNARYGKGFHGLRVLTLVRKNGLPVRPSAAPRCTAAIGSRRLVPSDAIRVGLSPGHFWNWRQYGVWLDAGYGWAFCDLYLSPPMLKKYAGKRLTGTISVRVGGTTVSRNYGARIVAKGPWIAHPPPAP